MVTARIDVGILGVTGIIGQQLGRRLDVDRANGMAVCVGRVRPCPVFHAKLVALGHNTVRGAAGAAILHAELLAADGWLNEGGAPWLS